MTLSHNIMIGLECTGIIYIADFGLAKQHSPGGSHIPFAENKRFIGTSRYASVGAHLGRELSRRDDLESLGYSMLQMFTGTLPWMNFPGGSSANPHRKIAGMKQSLANNIICAGAPEAMEFYLEEVRALGFSHQPNYEGLQNLLRGALSRMHLAEDSKFEWN